MTSQTEQQALNQARAEEQHKTILRLRTFTGIAGYEPELDEPEHQSYFEYERDLVNGLAVWRDTLNHRQGTVDLLIEQRDDARRSMDAEQKRRLEERENSNAGSRLVGKLLDVSFPEKRRYADLAKAVDDAWDIRHAAADRVREIETELANVSHWLDQMLTYIDAARVNRR